MSPQGHCKLGAGSRQRGAVWGQARKGLGGSVPTEPSGLPVSTPLLSRRSPHTRLGWGAGSRGSRRVLLHFLDSRKAPGASGQAPDRGVFILLLSSTSGAVAGPTHAGRSLRDCLDLCVCWGGGGRKEGPTASWHSGRSGEPHGGPGLFGGKQAAAVATPSLSPDPLGVSV